MNIRKGRRVARTFLTLSLIYNVLWAVVNADIWWSFAWHITGAIGAVLTLMWFNQRARELDQRYGPPPD